MTSNHLTLLALLGLLSLAACAGSPGLGSEHGDSLALRVAPGSADPAGKLPAPLLSEMVAALHAAPPEDPLDEAIDRALESRMPGARLAEGPQSYTLAIRPLLWFPQLDGDLRLEDSSGISTRLEIEDDLDIGDREGSPGGEVNLRVGIQDLWLSGFSFGTDGREVVAPPVVYGAISFTVPTRVDSDLDLDNLRLAYGLSIIDIGESNVRFGPIVGINYYHLESEASAMVAGVLEQESVEADVPIPFLGLHAEVALGDVVISGEASGFFIKLSDFDGGFLDLNGQVTWRPLPWLGAFAGYRYITFDVRADDGGRHFDGEVSLHGPFLGGELRF